MKQTLRFALFLAALLLLSWPAVAFCETALESSGAQSATVLTGQYQQFMGEITGDWQQYGQLFTELQQSYTVKLFTIVAGAACCIFLLHYLLIGAKKFSHDGEQILFFSFFVRLIHWVAALSFSLLVITGLMIIYGKYLGPGLVGQSTRSIHIISALVFSVDAVLMFVVWVRDMLPRAYDLKWMIIGGGYLSKAKKPVPAGKFNAGQKAWFWTLSLGGLVLAISGYMLYTFNSGTDALRIAAIAHSVAAAVLLGFYITHLYMSLFAIKGALSSMTSGYKPVEEVEILHGRYLEQS